MTEAFASDTLEAMSRAFEALPDPVRLVARDGSTLISNEAARLVAPDGLGHLCEEDRRGRDMSCPACQLDSVFDRGLFLRWHVVLRKPGEPDDYYEVTLSPVRGSGSDVEAVLEVLRDATATLGLEHYLIGQAESQEAEIERRLTEVREHSERADQLTARLGKLEETQAELLYKDRLDALTRLVAAMSHEIHTPLGAMMSSADLMHRTVTRLADGTADRTDDLATDVRARLKSLTSGSEVIQEGSKRIQRVLQSLRLFSRLDEAQIKQIDVREGLDSTIQLLRYRMGNRVRVTREYGDVPPVVCRADAFNQVFMNLLSNAIHAVAAEGEIRVATRREGEDVVVQISDDGAGIRDEDHERVFDLGFTTRRQGGGSGIGLALSRRIVEEHGGSIEVKSQVGEGSTFTVRVPLLPAAVAKRSQR